MMPDRSQLRASFPRLAPLVAAVAALLLATGCDEVVLSDQQIRFLSHGDVEGFAYFDADGSGTLTEPDEPYENLWIEFVTVGGGSVGIAVTDSLGEFPIKLPVGAYRAVLEDGHVPDTVVVFGVDHATPLVVGPETTQQIVFRVAFGTVPLAEVRAAPPGQRVITHGIALNPRNSFGDGVVHIQEGDVYLRATNVDRSGVSVGDSVRFIGVTAIDQGQPVLTNVKPVVLIDQAALVTPRALNTSGAASAANGTLDAALVEIRDAAVIATATVGSDFIVTVNDGSGPLDIVLRSFIGFDVTPYVPNVAVVEHAVGLLVPMQLGPGQTRWRLTPRFNGDISVDDGLP